MNAIRLLFCLLNLDYKLNGVVLVFCSSERNVGIALFGADVLDFCQALKRLIERYLVDPASSHMLCSRIKPCMSKYEHVRSVKLQIAHYISYSLFDDCPVTRITVVILELIRAQNLDSREKRCTY